MNIPILLGVLLALWSLFCAYTGYKIGYSDGNYIGYLARKNDENKGK